MVIDVNVKTLDANNYTFSVDENVTVKEFKEIIAETVHISVELQRLIYCGRVLKDDSKLSEYDVAGQTLHLVQKPPPSLRSEPSSRSVPTSSSSSSYGRGDESSILVGAFSLPQDALDANGLQQVVENVVSGMGEIGRNATVRSRTSEDGSSVDVHINLGHVPLHNEVAQRIQHANRILRYINRIIDELDRESNGTTRSENSNTEATPSSDQSSPTSFETQIAAHAAGAFAAATASAFSSIGIPIQAPIIIQGSLNQNANAVPRTNGNNNSASGPSEATGQSSQQSENATNDNSQRPRVDTNNRNIPVSELSNLISSVQRAEQRYRVHLQRFQQLISNDGVLNTTQAADAQRLQRSIFRAMHHFAHVYHLISDLSLNFSHSPPRNLCLQSSYSPFGIPAPPFMQFGGTARNRSERIPRTAAAATMGNNNNNNNNSSGNSTANSDYAATVGSTTTSTYSVPRFSQSNSTGQSSSVFVAQSPIVFMEVGSTNIERIPGPLSFPVPSRGNQTTNGSSQQNGASSDQNLPQSSAPPSFPYSSIFDPYLPCHSHYSMPEIRTRLSVGISTNAGNSNEQRANATTTGVPFQSLNQVLSGIMNAFLGQGTGAPPRAAPTQPQTGSISVDSSLIDLMQRLNNESRDRENNTRSSESNTGPSNESQENQQNASSGSMTDMFMSFVNGILQIINGQNTPGTVADFLNHVNGFNYSEGESIANDIFMAMGRVLNFQDLFQIFFGNYQPLDRVRDVLRNYIQNNILRGNEPNEQNIASAVDRIIENWNEGIDIISRELHQLPAIDFHATLLNFTRINLNRLIHFLINPPEQNGFGLALYTNIRTMLSHFVTLCFYCFADGTAALENMVSSMIRHVSLDLHPLVQQWMLTTAVRHMRDSISNLRLSDAEIMSYIVRRNILIRNAPQNAYTNISETTVETPVAENMDIENNEQTSESYTDVELDGVNPINGTSANIPTVVIGTESWHSAVPREWVPIITNDLQSQRRQGLQRPFSDAYMNGLPKKKRRIDQRSANMMQPSALRDALQNAIASSGVRPMSSRNHEDIVREACDDLNLQCAFEEEIKNEVKERIENDTDYSPDRFTNTNNYFTPK